MRKVLIKRWIPTAYKSNEDGVKIAVPGTGCMSQKFDTQAHFESWGISYDTTNDCNGNVYVMQSTVAIVVLSDGTVEEVAPCNLQFVVEDIESQSELLEAANMAKQFIDYMKDSGLYIWSDKRQLMHEASAKLDMAIKNATK
jgi:hypothetical protein